MIKDIDFRKESEGSNENGIQAPELADSRAVVCGGAGA